MLIIVEGLYASSQWPCKIILRSFKNSRCMSNNTDGVEPFRAPSMEISSYGLSKHENGYNFETRVRFVRIFFIALCLLFTSEVGPSVMIHPVYPSFPFPFLLLKKKKVNFSYNIHFMYLINILLDYAWLFIYLHLTFFIFYSF